MEINREEDDGTAQGSANQVSGGRRKHYNNNSVSGSNSRVQYGDNYYPTAQRRIDESVPRGHRNELLLDAGITRQPYRLKHVLGRLEANVDHLFEDDLTALHIAAWYGHLNCVEVLVKEGADVNAVTSKYGTPLVITAFRGHVDVIDLLLGTYKADINANGG